MIANKLDTSDNVYTGDEGGGGAKIGPFRYVFCDTAIQSFVYLCVILMTTLCLKWFANVFAVFSLLFYIQLSVLLFTTIVAFIVSFRETSCTTSLLLFPMTQRGIA